MLGLLALPVRRLVLAILVGVNLLLVCPGHADALHHLGPHLALMGEIEASDAASTGNTAQPENNGDSEAQARASASTHECVIRSGTGDAGEGASLATIAVDLTGPDVARPSRPLSILRTNHVHGASRPRLSPPDPPPQPEDNPV